MHKRREMEKKKEKNTQREMTNCWDRTEGFKS